MENAKYNYARALHPNVVKKQTECREYWKITNHIMNRNKAAVFTIVSDPDVIYSSTEEANLFASILVFN